MTPLYIDESGHTGGDLLNETQPLLIVASLRLAEDRVSQLYAPLRAATQAPEVKYANLSKYRGGQTAIIEFIRKLDANHSTFIFQLMHKRFALLGKLLDAIMEPVWYATGRDFYQEGRNLGFLNVLFMTSRSLAPAQLDAVLEALRPVFARADPQSIAKLSTALRDLAACDSGLARLVRAIEEAIAFRNRIPGGWSDLSKTDLQIQLPALVSVISAWNEDVPEDLLILTDESKELRSAFDDLMALSDQTEPAVIEHGSGRRMGFPLRIHDVRFCDSASTPGIQLADVAAGAVNHVAMVMNELIPTVPGYSDSLEKVISQWERIQQLFPMPHFTPQELRREGYNGSRVLDAAKALIEKGRKQNDAPEG
mgnify:CR=1 FL=1